MFKRYIALIICFALFAFTFVNADGEEQIKAEWLRQADILSSMELLDGYTPDNFGFNSAVSRAEFVDTIANFYFEYKINGSTGYADVPNEHWAASSIALAAEMNLISPAANFNPDNEILLTEAIKIAVSALGYGQIAEQDGGYPTGYLNYAARLGLMSNLGGNTFSRGDMITLMYNMLDAEVMEVNFGMPGQNFEIGDKLVDVLGYNMIKGIVVANNVVAINGAPIKAEDEIQIENITMICENSNALVGRRVECYYKYDSTIEEYVVIYISCIDDGVLKIKSEDITKLTSTELSYVDEDDDIEKLSLNGSLEIIYNGRREISLPENLFIPETGWVELTDYDRDGIYDVMFISSFEEYVVSVYSSADELIYDKIDRSRYIDVGGKLKRFEFYVNGEPAEIDSIAPNSLISVARSRDNTVLTIYASTNIISAKATEYGNDYVILDGAEYKFTKSFANNNYYDVSLKEFNNYYINSFGDISYADVANSKLYGYMLGVGGDGAMDSNVQVKLLDNEGVVKIYNTADKIRLNGSSMYSSGLDSSALLFTTDTSGALVFKPQLCTYTLDADGNIKTINVVGTNTDLLNTLVQEYDGTTSGIALRSYKTSQIMLNKYVLTAATKVFLIADEDKNMMVTTPSSLTPDTSYNAVIYDWEDAVVGAMVIDNRSGLAGSVSLNTEAVPVVVADVLKAIDDETGEELTKIYAYQNGTLIDMYPEDEDTKGNASATLPGFNNIPFSSLRKGDVMQVSTNVAGRISSFRLLFGMDRGMDGKTEVTYSESAATDATGTITGKYAKMYNIYGCVTDIYSNTLFKVNVATGTGQSLNGYTLADYDRILQTAGGKIYMYNTAKDEVTVISPSEIVIGDMVYARTRYTLTEEIYVVR